MATQPAQILFTGREATLLELELFRVLHERPLTTAQLAARLGLDESRAAALFEALAGGGLLERAGSRYANAEEVELTLERMAPRRARPARALLPALASLLVLLGGFAFLHARTAAAAGAAAHVSELRQPTVYLVSTPEEAVRVATGQVPETAGAPWGHVVTAGSYDEATWAVLDPATIPVVDVVSTPDEEAHTRTVIGDANTIRTNARMPKIQLIDLRGALHDVPVPQPAAR
jgi:hypothetical protein